jgi:predicted lipid-binding transport protein (Tim44 family)
MPSWASRRLPKLIGGLLGGVVGGAMGGIGWHFATIYADPPRITFIMIEAVLAVSLVIMLAIPRSPKLLILT